MFGPGLKLGIRLLQELNCGTIVTEACVVELNCSELCLFKLTHQ